MSLILIRQFHSPPPLKQVTNHLEMFFWSLTPSFQLWVFHFQHLIFKLGHFCSSGSCQDTPHSEPIDGSWVWRLVCLCVCKLIPHKNLIKNTYFWVFIYEVEGWRRLFARFFQIQKYSLSCPDWLSSVHIHFTNFFIIYSFASVCWHKQVLGPSGRGGWSPCDPKIRGSTPSVCKCLF